MMDCRLNIGKVSDCLMQTKKRFCWVNFLKPVVDYIFSTRSMMPSEHISVCTPRFYDWLGILSTASGMAHNAHLQGAAIIDK